jgi:hypothetical protein
MYARTITITHHIMSNKKDDDDPSGRDFVLS